MGYDKPCSIALQFGHAVFDFADSTTYNFGAFINVNPSTSTTVHRVQSPVSGLITRITFSQSIGTVGTAEDVTLNIMVNAAVTPIGTFHADASPSVLNSFNKQIQVKEGDLIYIQIVTPAWATNPLQTRSLATVVIEWG